jgi:chromosome undetermined SCAF250, whole genome shotgun sequence. (fragment)
MINVGGMLSRHKIALNGSGCSFIYGYLDSNFKPGLSQEEARQLAINGNYYLMLF